MEGERKRKGGSAMDHLTTLASSLISSTLQSPSATSPSLLPGKVHLFHLLRRFLLISLHFILRLILLLLSPALSSSIPLTTRHFPSSYSSSAGPTPDAAAARALSHVLSVVARVPVTSRKYELVRSLAERLLDDNLRYSAASGHGVSGGGLEKLNRAALSAAFSRTLRRLESAVPAPGDRSLDLIYGAVRSGLRRLAESPAAAAAEKEGVWGERSAGKLAAELLWLAQKMADCGAGEEAVARWGEAAGLARIALSTEPRLQVAFVRVSAFLFKHANAKHFGRKGGEAKEDDEECAISRYRMAMLATWLPLLCRATNGTDAPIMSSGERAEMVKVLEEMIEKLSWDQQEEVLALWLHHFTSCPDSDWPNLESCYTRWYSESRNILLLK